MMAELLSGEELCSQINRRTFWAFQGASFSLKASGWMDALRQPVPRAGI